MNERSQKKQDPRIGLAIIGSGNIASTHADAIRLIPEANLLGFHSRNRKTTERISKQHHTKAWPDLERLLAEPSLDAILIATASGAHLEPAVKALRAGKHVLCEKPIEVTGKRATQMIEAAKNADRILGGFFPLRNSLAAQSIRQALDAGRFGRLSFVSAKVKWWRDHNYYSDSNWRGTYALDGGGALMNQGIHAVDLIQWLGGFPTSVFARQSTLAHSGLEVEDTLVATVEFPQGALGVIEVGTSAYPGMDLTVEISGDKGTAVLQNDQITLWQFAEEQAEDEAIRSPQDSSFGSGSSDPKGISCEGHRQQIVDFLDAVTGRSKLTIDGNEALQAVRIVEACYASAKRNQPISL